MLNAYHIKGPRLVRGIVIARSTLHAVQISEGTGLHTTGKPIKVRQLATTSLPGYVKRFCRDGHPGRVLMPHIFRKAPLLILPEP